MPELMSWKDLLSFETFDDYKNQYGPHTQAVVNCFETLDTISWFCQVGAETVGKPNDGIDTWSASVELIYHKGAERHDRDGQLKGPAAAVAEFREAKKLKKWIDKAVAAVSEYAQFARYIPAYFEKDEVDFMTRYMNKYLENLLTEIIASDELECTYFREQLSYWEAGHFTCGWSGDWPEGHHQVF